MRDKNDDRRDYLVFIKDATAGWRFIYAGEEIGHDQALAEAIDVRPVRMNYPVRFMTVCTEEQTVREHNVKITTEELS